MNQRIALLVFASLLLLGGEASGASWEVVAFRDDCDASDGMLDPDVWVINHPGQTWWVQGRTHFPDPLSTTGPFPRIENGVCVIEHHLYNPWDLGTPNTTFLGGEFHTVLEFEPIRSYRFEARVRSHAYPDGLVTAFFLYGYDGAKSDEIDFEFVSNNTNDDTSYPSGDPVLVNTWNESVQKPQYVEVPGLDLTQWNTFRIYWYPALGRVDWTWVDAIAGETWLRTETDPSWVPDEPMALYFNFWAPTAAWPDAYEPNLQPVDDPEQNEIYRYEIDYVEIRVSAAPLPALSDWKLIAMAVVIAAAAGLFVRRPFPILAASGRPGRDSD